MSNCKNIEGLKTGFISLMQNLISYFFLCDIEVMWPESFFPGLFQSPKGYVATHEASTVKNGFFF